MSSSLAARVAWYRFRCTLRERWVAARTPAAAVLRVE